MWFENILKCQCEANFVMILVSVLKNAYKVFENILFEHMMWKNVYFLEKIVNERLIVLPTEYRSCYFSSPLEIGLSIPLVGR